MLGGSVAAVMASLALITATNERRSPHRLARRLCSGLGVAVVTAASATAVSWWGDDLRPVALVLTLLLFTVAQGVLALPRSGSMHEAAVPQFERPRP